MNKLVNTIILSLSIGLLIIGVHQLMVDGLMSSYWIFMFTISLLLLYKYRKKSMGVQESDHHKKAKK